MLDPLDESPVFKVANMVVYAAEEGALTVPTTIIDPDFNAVIVISVLERFNKVAMDSVIF
jgi:hypothetical protein